MSNPDNKKIFSWFYWLIGLIVLRFIFPAVASIMNQPNQEQRSVEQEIQQQRQQLQQERQQYR